MKKEGIQTRNRKTSGKNKKPKSKDSSFSLPTRELHQGLTYQHSVHPQTLISDSYSNGSSGQILVSASGKAC